jgi:hypothetical protein
MEAGTALYGEALKVRRKLRTEEIGDSAEHVHQLALDCFGTRDGKLVLETAKEELAKTPPDKPDQQGTWQALIGHAYEIQGDRAKAIDYYDMAVAKCTKKNPFYKRIVAERDDVAKKLKKDH